MGKGKREEDRRIEKASSQKCRGQREGGAERAEKRKERKWRAGREEC